MWFGNEKLINYKVFLLIWNHLNIIYTYNKLRN